MGKLKAGLSKCGTCEVQMARAALRKHLNKTGHGWACSTCVHRPFADHQGLSMHFASKHKGQTLRVCAKCRLTMSSHELFTRHTTACSPLATHATPLAHVPAIHEDPAPATSPTVEPQHAQQPSHGIDQCQGCQFVLENLENLRLRPECPLCNWVSSDWNVFRQHMGTHPRCEPCEGYCLDLSEHVALRHPGTPLVTVTSSESLCANDELRTFNRADKTALSSDTAFEASDGPEIEVSTNYDQPRQEQCIDSTPELDEEALSESVSIISISTLPVSDEDPSDADARSSSGDDWDVISERSLQFEGVPVVVTGGIGVLDVDPTSADTGPTTSAFSTLSPFTKGENSADDDNHITTTVPVMSCDSTGTGCEKAQLDTPVANALSDRDVFAEDDTTSPDAHHKRHALLPGAVSDSGGGAAPGSTTHPSVPQISKWYCGLCGNDLEQPTATICGHIFCFSCILNELAKKNLHCPTCKCPILVGLRV